jgi:predicted RNA-binding protein with PIN domain
MTSSHWRDQRMVLVCDGAAPPDADLWVSDVEVVYAGGGREADAVIEQRIAADSAPRHLVVVSNDRRIIRAARRRRAKTMSSEDFLRDVVRSASQRCTMDEPEKPAGDSEVNHWMQAFQLDAAHLKRLRAEADRPTADEPADSSGQPDATPPPPSPGQGEPPPDPPDSPPTDKQLDETETDYWLRQFGFDQRDDEQV